MVLVIVALSIVARLTSEGGPAVVVVRVLVHEARCTLWPVQGEVVVMENDLRQPEVLQQVLKAFEAHDSIVAILVKNLAQEVLMLAVALGGFLGLQAGHRAQYAEEDVAPETHCPVTLREEGRNLFCTFAAPRRQGEPLHKTALPSFLCPPKKSHIFSRQVAKLRVMIQKKEINAVQDYIFSLFFLVQP